MSGRWFAPWLDAALLLNVISEPDDRDWQTLPHDPRDYRLGLDEGIRGWRIAYSRTLGYAKAGCGGGRLRGRRRGGLAGPPARTSRRAILDFPTPFASFEALWGANLAGVLAGIPPEQQALMDPGYVEAGVGWPPLHRGGCDGGRHGPRRADPAYERLLPPVRPADHPHSGGRIGARRDEHPTGSRHGVLVRLEPVYLPLQRHPRPQPPASRAVSRRRGCRSGCRSPGRATASIRCSVPAAPTNPFTPSGCPHDQVCLDAAGSAVAAGVWPQAATPLRVAASEDLRSVDPTWTTADATQEFLLPGVRDAVQPGQGPQSATANGRELCGQPGRVGLRFRTTAWPGVPRWFPGDERGRHCLAQAVVAAGGWMAASSPPGWTRSPRPMRAISGSGLKQPFSMLLTSLANPASTIPVIMRAADAQTDPEQAGHHHHRLRPVRVRAG